MSLDVLLEDAAVGDLADLAELGLEFKSKQQDLRKLEPDETRQIVKAICDADEEARRDVGRDASDRVAREVNDSFRSCSV